LSESEDQPVPEVLVSEVGRIAAFALLQNRLVIQDQPSGEMR
jgi:hypothetical protein